MQVSRYLFQSPYQNQVQIGRPDPSSVSNEEKQTQTKNPVDNVTNAADEAQKQNTLYTGSNNIIDIYA